MRPVEHVVVVHCKAPRERVWPVLSNSQLQNQFLGLPPLATAPLEHGGGAARFVTRQKIGGVMLEYAEEPFAWSEQRFFSWRRDMRGGPTATVAGHYAFEDDPSGTGCIVTIRLTTVPRSLLYWPLVWFVQGKNARGLARYLEAIDASDEHHEAIRMALTTSNRDHAEKAAKKLLATHDAALVARLVETICDGGDLEVQALRPFELAREWGAPRDAVLKLCLSAVSAGALELLWSVLCPSCRTSSERLPSLRDLTTEGHCHACDIRFGVDLSRAVEATFRPHVAIRQVEVRQFCIGGPMLTPHIVAQTVVRPGEAATLEVAKEPGRYRLFVRGGGTAVVDVVEGGPTEATVRVTGAADDAEGAPPVVEPQQLDVAPAGRIVIDAEPTASFHAKLERTAWNFEAATAMHVTALPEFRAQFGGEALRPGLVLKIANVAVFFTDLCGSTALYAKVGDAAAFGIVSDCLEYGRAIVEEFGGTLIKTMGDAVMAAFSDDDDAVAAGAATLLRWAEFAKTHPLARELEVKVGVASGPCTIVTANGVLDYFGQTVNTAARVQHQAGGRQLVLPSSLAHAVPEGLVELERFDAQMKGLAAPIELVRLAIAPNAEE